jgi:hypothetical protein
MDFLIDPIYYQLIIFQNNPLRHELTFNFLTPGKQFYIQTLVRGLELDFTYSTITNTARVTRRSHIQSVPSQKNLFVFSDFTQISSLSSDQVDIQLSSAHDTPPSTIVDWNDLLSVQGGIDWNLSETMPTSKLELPEQNGAINGTWLRSPEFGSDTKTNNPITGFWEAPTA